jgi:4,5-dihydroxyphthalate decarboxylase
MVVSKPKLTLGVADHDLNRPLIDGEVGPADFDLDVVWQYEDGERHRRMIRDRAYDACEFSFCNYLILRGQGSPLTGIPVFPNRKFRHSYIFVNTAAGIREPRDLEGKRVGLRGWAATASLWVRGILQRYYDVDLTKVRWYSPAEPLDVPLAPGIVLEPLPRGQDVDAMLVAGDLDAVIFPDVLPSVQRGAPEVRRLFEDYKAEEQAFYQRTRIFPTSHLVAFQPDVVEAHPRAPLSLLQAFRASRDACFHRLEEQQMLALSWAGALLAEQRALMGPNYWPYNVADNRHVLETIVSFAHEQGLIPRPIPADDLFVPETVTAPGA